MQRKKKKHFIIISMISKALISRIRLLHHKKHRDEQNLFIVEGVKSCLETLHSKLEVVQCFVTERFDKFDGGFSLSQAGSLDDGSSLRLTVISEKEMERISCLKTAPEILCVVKKQQYDISNLDDEKPLLVLDSIHDPGNLGSIIRTADWFGFSQILCSDECVEYTNPKVIQATMGSFLRVKIVYTTLSDYLKTQSNRNIYGLYMKGEPIHKQSFKFNDIVLIGSESHGISENITSFVKTKIEIPLFPHEDSTPESLNASIAVAIFMYSYRELVNF